LTRDSAFVMLKGISAAARPQIEVTGSMNCEKRETMWSRIGQGCSQWFEG